MRGLKAPIDYQNELGFILKSKNNNAPLFNSIEPNYFSLT